MAETFTYDAFISHSAKDKPAVRELAERLRNDGLRVWLDDWEIKPGDAILLKIQEGLEQSRTLVLVMSQHASASEWVTFEHHSVLFRDPTNQQRRFIPVRLDDAEIRDALKQFAYVDWRQRSEEQYAQLLTACRPAAAETAALTKRKVQARPSKVFKGHTAAVWGVAVTPDGQCVISGSYDNTVRVWELDSGRCLATLKGHTGLVRGVAVTPDGRCIVSGSVDNTVRVWELDSGRCLATLKGHTALIWAVAVTPDGRRVISGAADNTVRVWELDSGRCLATLEGHTDDVAGVVVTPDGQCVISGSYDNTVRVWELDSGR
ncbi:MAG TPA: TIR domain-containing protein, partial [Blastocatellia bacterium]